MNRPALWLGVATLVACGEKGQRSGAPGASTSVTPPPESAAAPSTTTAAVPVPSPFPADKDTGRFATELAAGASQVPSCGSTLPQITGDSIGPFRPDMPLVDLVRRCPRLLYGWVMISDGYPVPTVAARVGGAMVTAFANDSSAATILNRIELVGPGPRTAEGVGVGSTLAELERKYGAPQASESDCLLQVWFDSRPGLAFRMAHPAGRECGAISEPPLPPEVRVVAVILISS